ncbi:MAG: adenylosuccinate lyase [Candidatus Dadabacteria bacterium]|nr:adenylosuccinate lyase [Candidatus Dadabacteria bacterium]NIS07618.1 adenylosuccinate lyase [Candidatus Dadabacteria bacterium]NIV42072.1 adenylosuccinate lyase [Candidatus Dadabacteria bacterium]NIX16477.1 adenylosuccinate lyase [Candidatus Dadabacteria bacterium]NIY21256.1 adenylosuccinate lyase [Candidatus Dadabacteria bacterium]
MIKRYSREEISSVWTDESKYSYMLKVELAACDAWAKLGKIPKRSLQTIKKKAAFKVFRINKLEKTLKHDVISFLTSVAENVGPDSRFIHMGLTSSDVLDTAFALQLRDSSDIILKDIKEVLTVIKKLARKHKYTAMVGRTHGIHAEPTTFGLVAALWYDEMNRNLERMKRAKDAVSVGQISGAVGAYVNIPPSIERDACRILKLKPAAISTQVIQRDLHAEFFLTLAIIASTIEKIALQIRHFQRTEVLEAEEGFTKGQKGSSAMPHKKNPILSENLCGLARIVKANGSASLENNPLWHERDISHSSVERVIGPDSTILIDFMLARVKSLLENLVIYPKSMKRNMDITNGLIFSEKVLLKLVDKGITREKAYEIVQRNAMECWQKKTPYKDLLISDPEVMKYLSKKEVESCFDLKGEFNNIDLIFKRVFS